MKRDLQTWTSIILAAGFLLVLAGLGMQRAWRAVGPAAHVVDPIRQVPPLERLRQKQGRVGPVELATGFEASAPMNVQRHSDTHFVVEAGPRHRHWFLFRLDGVAGKIVRIDLTDVNLTRWKTLNPVYSYTTDLADPAAFTTVATRSPGALTEAWNGPPLPQTAGIQQWHFIENVWMSGRESGQMGGPHEGGTLHLVQRFEQDTVYVAMKYPYTPSYHERYMVELSRRPYATVHEVGRSAEGRPLHVVQIGEGDPTQTPCVLIYAREHGDEHDSSWPAIGAIEFLISDDPEAQRIRDNFTFLVIPMLDPDAAAAGIHNNIIASFSPEYVQSPEALVYAKFFHLWAHNRARLDLVLNLHNVESNEAPHLFCPQMEPDEDRLQSSEVLHQLIVKRGEYKNLSVYSRTPRRLAHSPERLGGWLSEYYGTLHVPYEVNSQAPTRHLSIAEVQQIGCLMVLCSTQYLGSQYAEPLLRRIDIRREERERRWRMFQPRLDGFDVLLREYWTARMPLAAQ